MPATVPRSKGLMFALPWIIGMGVFSLYPFMSSIYYSFTDFSVLEKPIFIGVDNFKEMARDAIFWKVLTNTVLYAGLSIPVGLAASLTLALLMNNVRRGQAFYSAIFYLPHLIPSVVTGILWLFIFTPGIGLLNNALQPFFDVLNSIRYSLDPSLLEYAKQHPEAIWGPPPWLSGPAWAVPTLVLTGLWTVGQTAFIYLAKLQDVPHELYEAAEIDGASILQKIRHITLPMISPIIFFNVVMAIIGAFQIFAEPFLIFGPEGGVDRSAYFLPHYIWNNAFQYFRMGYACAMSWMLFVIILALTMLAFRLSRDRVYYAGR
jgi:multiple sugar transport system permease protein